MEVAMTQLQTLLTGRGLLESTRWHNGRLYVSDWTAGEVIAINPDREHEIVAHVDSLPLCFDWLPDGRMIAVDSKNRRLLCIGPDGTSAFHANLAGLGGGWNDIVIDGRGNSYVNRIGFDMTAGADFSPGTVAVVTPDGTARQVADGIAFPNGMAITADNATLLVADSYGNQLTAFDIEGNGDLTNRRVWADTGEDHPDGICIDAEGAVWYADVGNQHCVRIREGGEVLQTVDVDRGCFDCVLGGSAGTTLFIAAAEWHQPPVMVPPGTGRIFSVEVNIGWPPR